MLLMGPERSECPENQHITFVSQWQGKMNRRHLMADSEKRIYSVKSCFRQEGNRL